MSITKTEAELLSHKTAALTKLEKYLDTLISSSDEHLRGKADKISYWLEDYAKFLDYETKFDPTKFPRYKRGQIIKVHLGFNIGSEEGGLHYAVVIENNNPYKSSTLNIVPLTSVKSTTDISRLRTDLGQVYLGNELYRLLIAKVSTLNTTVINEFNTLNTIVNTLPETDPQYQSVNNRISKLQSEIATLNKMTKEISKMKKGSIALVGQITTISKIRIYDPKNSCDVLSGIKVSNETLDKIDTTLRQLFTKI